MNYQELGRILLPEESPLLGPYQANSVMRQRRIVLRETLIRIDSEDERLRLRKQALRNVAFWLDQSRKTQIHKAGRGVDGQAKVQVIRGDWGDVTQKLTQKHGQVFAVLNMANAFTAGGGYVEGMSAQEENMFRRTDCHFYVGCNEFDRQNDRYTSDMTALVNAQEGRVYLDSENVRVCLRGSEDCSRDDLGYDWISEDQIFPFYELKSAALDLRTLEYNKEEMTRRIAAQLDTLIEHKIRHVILGAFGCGAFRNPASEVAGIYQKEINARCENFDVVAFAIHTSGGGPDNFSYFDLLFG